MSVSCEFQKEYHVFMQLLNRVMKISKPVKSTFPKRYVRTFGEEVYVVKQGSTWKAQAQTRDNIAMDLKEIEWKSVDWINVAQGRDKCYDHGTKLRVAQKVRNSLTGQGHVSFSRRVQFHGVSQDVRLKKDKKRKWHITLTYFPYAVYHHIRIRHKRVRRIVLSDREEIRQLCRIDRYKGMITEDIRACMYPRS